MKTIKYFLVLLIAVASLSSCVVQERRGGYVEGHYNYGPYGGRHWVPGHYR
ncbi:hypothetical protein [Mucilaginibacter agri]|uniref:hypothetical protein n=1 Tax=Mucilaginibacter agri TaxID=2695265 RepID=UPI0014123B71|nr:hypothetical protein [Mucilaginibacter agri]